jgi:asparagine synthase (glutamine-hydrolysing)
MCHRGPDGAGSYRSPDGRVGLVHRRLSIIDLTEQANQPMSSPDGQLVLVFNGEIYNHHDIRRDLIGLGVEDWRTDHSDTEVLLYAYRQWGIDCLEKLRGMFAFALWDAREEALWLVRDRIGKKPLYYSRHNGRVTFASEIKALLSDPQQPREVDEQAFFHYLSFLTSPAPQTLFAGIRKVPGGCWLRIQADGTEREHRYWDVWDHTEPLLGVDEQEIAERVLSELRDAVSLRKVSDVPVGVFLSGGIDSSTNSALFSEGESQPVKTFSVGYHGDHETYRNELHYARKMAAEVGADHHEILLDLDDVMDFLPRMVELQDEPIADPVCVPVYYVSKLARDNGVVVAQVGEGADELFCGYPTWARAIQLNGMLSRVPRPLLGLGVNTLNAIGRDNAFRFEYLRRAAAGQPAFWSGAEAFTQVQKERLLSPRLRREFEGYTSWEVLRPLHQRFTEKAWDQSYLHWMTHSDLHLRLPELLLMRVDKMAMGVSLEGRVPFLDHKFVELALSIPAELKIRDGQVKRVLKRAVRGVIPDELIDRPKQGFGVPVYEYFFDRLGGFARGAFDELTRETDFLDRRAVDRLLEPGNGPQAWFLLNFALWWRTYIRES